MDHATTWFMLSQEYSPDIDKIYIHKSDYLYLSICMQMLEIAKDSKTPLINDSANLNVQDKHIPYAPSGTEMNLTSWLN